MEYQLQLLDICLSDYFSGNSNPVMALPVWKDMTKQELVEAIVSEYNNLWEYLHHSWPDVSSEEMTKMAEEFILTDTPFSDTGICTLAELENDDSLDSVYLYINCVKAEE